MINKLFQYSPFRGRMITNMPTLSVALKAGMALAIPVDQGHNIRSLTVLASTVESWQHPSKLLGSGWNHATLNPTV
jgi:hypothetical protein